MNFVKIIDCCTILSGGTPSKGNKAFWTGRIPWFSPKDFQDFSLSKSIDYISEDAVQLSSARIVEKGAILVVVRSGILAHTLPVGITRQKSSFNQDIKALIPDESYLPEFIAYYLKYREHSALRDGVKRGATVHSLSSEYLQETLVPVISKSKQKDILNELETGFAAIKRIRESLYFQISETASLSNSIINDSISRSQQSDQALARILAEIRHGVGPEWKKYRVLGATREGLALAKEPPGKKPERYKPVTPGTVFYNPMRIMIGSIAFVDEDDEPGITSPDYVVLKGKEGILDSRWFYYWLRSPMGERCIQSLARGAVRERMLFNRLSEGTIELPEYSEQLRASKALAEIKSMRKAVEAQIRELELVPQKLLSKIFDN